MTRIIKLVFGALFCIVLFNIGTVSADTKGAKVISHKKINEFLPNEDIIVEKALKGELIDTEYTKVNLIEDENEGTKTVEIDKVISETKYEDGQIDIEGEKTAIILSSSNGSTSEETFDSTKSASVVVNISYNKRTIKRTPTVKMTSFSVKPKRHSSQFQLLSLNYEARARGVGYTASGQPTTKLETTGVRTINNPVHNTSYSRSISSWTKYVAYVEGGSTGVYGTLNFKRQGNNTTYKVNYSVSP